jgi:hypothetical protein
MTDEQKALALACECAGRKLHHYARMSDDLPLKASITAHASTIMQHEAFKREVSDFMVEIYPWTEAGRSLSHMQRERIRHYILPNPVDPFVALVGEAVWNDPNEPDAVDCAASILNALAKRGGKIVWEEAK